jgi:hypothetical protein
MIAVFKQYHLFDSLEILTFTQPILYIAFGWDVMEKHNLNHKLHLGKVSWAPNHVVIDVS